MENLILRLFPRRSLLRRFTFISFFIILAGMLGLGWWVGEQIKAGVVKESAATTAFYMDSFIAPHLQELDQAGSLSPEHIAQMQQLFSATDFGRNIVSFKVWDKNGVIVYSTNPALIGQQFLDDLEQQQSFQGEVVAELSDLTESEHAEERRLYKRLLQIYSPIRLNGSDKIIAVSEFYQKVDNLEASIARAQSRSWLVTGGAMTAIYLLLVGFVGTADATIRRQEARLSDQVEQLTVLLARNDELSERVRRAAANATELNERFLRRISGDLHDGPIQELSLVLLHIDQLVAPNGGESASNIQKTLERALQEIRDISRGFGLPQIEKLTLPEILTRVTASHERRTATRVDLRQGDLPDEISIPAKITAYRIIQEALNNSFHHAGGVGQKVQVRCEGGFLHIEVSDQGPGFDTSKPIDWEEHLGLASMRERVESLGGEFEIESQINHGTRILARIPGPECRDSAG